MPNIDPFSTEGAKRIAQITGQQPAPIPAAVLSSPTPPLNLPSPSVDPVPTVPTLDSILAYEETPAEKRQKSILDDAAAQGADLSKENPVEGQEAVYRTQQEQQFGLVDKRATVRDLTTQFNGLNAEASAIPLQIQDEFTGRGATKGGVEPIQTSRLRNVAIRQLGISAALNAANGNLATAQDQVDSAVNARFAPLKAKLEAQRAQLAALEPTLNREEKRRAEKVTAQLAERERTLSKAEENQKTIYQTMLTAAQNGADAVTLRAIESATSPQAAVTLASKALGAKFADDKKQQEFENNIALAQLAVDQQNANSSSGVTADPIQILAYAQQYASTGTIPTGLPKGTFGLVSQVAKELPKPEGTIIDLNTGTKPQISDVKIDGLAALYDISKKVEDLKALDAERNHGIISGAFSKTFGTKDTQRYLDLRTEVIDLLSRARTGAALTASEEKFYSDQLPARISNPLGFGANSQLRIDNFATKIAGTLETKLKANQTALVGFSKVNIGGTEFVVGQTVTNSAGQRGRVNADGTITLIQ